MDASTLSSLIMFFPVAAWAGATFEALSLLQVILVITRGIGRGSAEPSDATCHWGMESGKVLTASRKDLLGTGYR